METKQHKHSLFEDIQAIVTGTLAVAMGVLFLKEAGAAYRRYHRACDSDPLLDRS